MSIHLYLEVAMGSYKGSFTGPFKGIYKKYKRGYYKGYNKGTLSGKHNTRNGLFGLRLPSGAAARNPPKPETNPEP